MQVHHAMTHSDLKADADPFGQHDDGTESEAEQQSEPLQNALGFRQAQEYHAWSAWREEA